MIRPPYKSDRLPIGVAKLERDKRGFPIPWFVDRADDHEDGEPDFRYMDPRKFAIAVREKRCWICGGPLYGDATFVAGPMCGINRTSAEPPCHHACALFAAKACPFLAQPKMRRNEKGLEDKGQEVAGTMIKRNPGVTMLWRTDDYKVFQADPEKSHRSLISMGEPKHVSWFCEGREATAAEVAHSISTGLPILLKVAAEEGAEACFELGQATQIFARHIPKQKKERIRRERKSA
jgi:hypothetical protein